MASDRARFDATGRSGRFVAHGTVEQFKVDILSVEAVKAEADICDSVGGNLGNVMANIVEAEVKPQREVISQASDRVERIW